MKVSRFENCGSHAGYERHRRAGEKACADCRAAERVRVREYRRRCDEVAGERIAEAFSDADNGADMAVVRQVVSGGQVVDVAVPVFTDAVDSARWRLGKVRAALEVAHPRDVAALARVEEETVSLLGELERKEKPRKLSALDQLAVKRAERLQGHN